MLFTPEAIFKQRRELLDQMKSGALTRRQAFESALALDPFDAVALRGLAADRLEAGDKAAAKEYAWRAAEADPCVNDVWHILHKILLAENDPLAVGVMELALNKTLRDEESFQSLQVRLAEHPLAANVPAEALVDSLLEEAERKREEEPPEINDRLQPHRLADEVLDAESGLDEEVVDSIVADGARCAPLLVGILRGTIAGSLPSGEVAPAAASVAMLGEIGDPAWLPEVVECSTSDDDDIMEAADWAALRIALRRPEESLAVLRKMTPGASAQCRSSIAATMRGLGSLPELGEAFEDLLVGLETFDEEDREFLFNTVTQAMMRTRGAQGREAAWSLFRRYRGALPLGVRAELQKAEEAIREMTAVGEDPTMVDSELTVYDFCSGFYTSEGGEEDTEDEDEFTEPVRRHIDIGRNDPCWCGSGKKYKKCHLDADQEAVRD